MTDEKTVLIARVAHLENQVREFQAADEIESLRQQLAEYQEDLLLERKYSDKRDAELVKCQAREKVLRDALHNLNVLKNYKDANWKDAVYQKEQPLAWNKTREGLAMPSDSTALDRLLKAVIFTTNKNTWEEDETEDQYITRILNIAKKELE